MWPNSNLLALQGTLFCFMNYNSLLTTAWVLIMVRWGWKGNAAFSMDVGKTPKHPNQVFPACSPSYSPLPTKASRWPLGRTNSPEARVWLGEHWLSRQELCQVHASASVRFCFPLGSGLSRGISTLICCWNEAPVGYITEAHNPMTNNVWGQNPSQWSPGPGGVHRTGWDRHQPGFCRASWDEEKQTAWRGIRGRQASCSWTMTQDIGCKSRTESNYQSKPYPTQDLCVLIGRAGWGRRTRQSQRSPQALIVQEPKSVVLRESRQLSTRLDAIAHLSAHTWMTLSVHTSGWHHLSLVPP